MKKKTVSEDIPFELSTYKPLDSYRVTYRHKGMFDTFGECVVEYRHKHLGKKVIATFVDVNDAYAFSDIKNEELA